jgi:hypothetical protein
MTTAEIQNLCFDPSLPNVSRLRLGLATSSCPHLLAV